MQLYDFNKLETNKRLARLTKVLRKDYGVDLKVYEALSYDELEMFLNDLEHKKYQTVSESKFNAYYQDSEYAKITFLTEAIRMMLREISPKRKPKKKKPTNESVLREDKIVFSVDNEEGYNAIMDRYGNHIDWQGDYMVASEEVFGKIEELFAEMNIDGPNEVGSLDETLDFKVHGPTGVAVDHDIDEDKERPDLYWRKHQWEAEHTKENQPVTAQDAAIAGQAYNTDWSANNKTPEEINNNHHEQSKKMDAYAQNQMPVGGTHENEQLAGVYVAIMNPNRFLDDNGAQKIMAIEPVDKSSNEISPLTRRVSPKMVDVAETVPEITETAHEGKEPNKIIAVYEDGEEMPEELKLKGLSELVENTMLSEGELERAEITMASKDVIMKLQSMIEDLGKMGTDDIMPMVDGIRNNFGGNLAQKFSGTVEGQIQAAADAIQEFKNTMETFANTFEKRISDEDVESPINDLSNDLSSDADLGDTEELPIGDTLGNDDDLGDELGGDEDGSLGGDDAAASEEPLGRARKESRIVTLNGKKVKLTTEQLVVLAKARKIMERVRTLGTLSNIPPLNMITPTVVIQVHGKKVRLNEEQLQSLIFAKKWKKRVDEKKANIVKLSESQAKRLVLAKKLTEKFRQLVENTETSLQEKKPSAGLSKKKKSAIVKKAKAGKDIGKPGKGFEKVKQAAAKSGAKDPEAVAAASMWKNVPR